MVEESEQSKVRRAWQVAVMQAKQSDGDDGTYFFGVDVGSATILAVDAELTLLREVAEAAHRLMEPHGGEQVVSGNWCPEHQRRESVLREKLAALDKAKEAGK